MIAHAAGVRKIEPILDRKRHGYRATTWMAGLVKGLARELGPRRITDQQRPTGTCGNGYESIDQRIYKTPGGSVGGAPQCRPQ